MGNMIDRSDSKQIITKSSKNPKLRPGNYATRSQMINKLYNLYIYI